MWPNPDRQVQFQGSLRAMRSCWPWCRHDERGHDTYQMPDSDDLSDLHIAATDTREGTMRWNDQTAADAGPFAAQYFKVDLTHSIAPEPHEAELRAESGKSTEIPNGTKCPREVDRCGLTASSFGSKKNNKVPAY